MNEEENNQFNSEPNSFGLPRDYFQNSANTIMNKIEWEEEHTGLPALTRLKNGRGNSEGGFKISAAYFDKKEGDLELIAFPELAKLKNNSVFSVPENYFTSLEMDLLAELIEDNENELSGFEKLNKIKRQNNFKVADDYFPGNETSLPALLYQGNSRKNNVFSLFKRRMSYSVAALLVMVAGLWMYDYYFTALPVKDCGTIACIDKVDLVKTKNLENLDDEDLYELVNPNDLEKKLENKKPDDSDKNKTDSSLKDISVDDLMDAI